MNIKRIIIGTVVGAITLFVLGYLIFELAFGEFYAANMGSATGVVRDNPVIWASVLASISYALLLTLAIEAQGGPATIVNGLKLGAIIGFLVWFTVDVTFYGILNLTNLTLAIVDPLLELVHAAISGAVIAAAIGRISSGRQAAKVDEVPGESSGQQ